MLVSKTTRLISLVLLLIAAPMLVSAQASSVVTVFSQYCEQLELSEAGAWADCSAESLRENAIEASDAYLKIYQGAKTNAGASFMYEALHFEYKDTDLLVVATTENRSISNKMQTLKVYQRSGTTFEDVTTERFPLLSQDDLKTACEENGGDFEAGECTWAYELVSDSRSIIVLIAVMPSEGHPSDATYASFVFDSEVGKFVKEW